MMARIMEMAKEKRNKMNNTEKEDYLQMGVKKSDDEEKKIEDRKRSDKEERKEDNKEEGPKTCFHYIRGKCRHGLSGKILCG